MFTQGRSFNMSNQLEAGGFIPADRMAVAVSTSHIVEIMNGRFVVWDKDGNLLSAKTQNKFWEDAGATITGPWSFDPRIRYDETNERFFVVAADGVRQPNNNFLVAISSSADPLGAWEGYTIPSGSDDHWMDYPTMGHDADGVYIMAQMIPTVTGAHVESQVLCVPKSDLLAGNIDHLSQWDHLTMAQTGYSCWAANPLDGGGLPAYLVSSYNETLLQVCKIEGPINTPTFTPELAWFDVTWTQYSAILPGVKIYVRSAPQPHTAPEIEVKDVLFDEGPVIRDGSFWSVRCVPYDYRSAIQFHRVELDTWRIIQETTIWHPSLYLFLPSITVNSSGDVIVSCSACNATTFLGSYCFTGETSGEVTTFSEEPMMLRAGLATFNIAYWYPGVRRNRWGDHCSTVIDPADGTGKTFWTFNGWCQYLNQWGLEGSEIIAGGVVPAEPPPVPTGLLAVVSGSTVTLFWNVSVGATGYRISRDGIVVGTSATNSFSDTSVPNGTYTYKVLAYDADGNCSAWSTGVEATVYVDTPIIVPGDSSASPYVHKMMVNEEPTNIAWWATDVKAVLIRQKSAVKIHVKVDDEASETGVDSYTLEGVVDRSIPLEFMTVCPNVSLVIDSGAAHDGMVEIWELRY